MKKKIINYPAIIIFLMIVVVGLGYLFLDYKYNYIDDVNLNKSLTLCCQVEANVESDMCQDFFANGSHYSSTGDTLTVYHYILEFTPLGYLNLILVALVSIMVLYKISKIFNCGEAKTMLVRESYLKFKKNLVKNAFKYALVIPIAFTIIFIFCMIVCKGNFDAKETINGSIASFPEIYLNMGWKFFFLQIFSIFIMTLIYAFISLISARIVNNYYASIVVSYLIFMVIEVISYCGIGIILLLNVFKFDVIDCFNLINQFNFYRAENYLLYIGIRIVILISLVLIFKLVYKDKESFVKFVEKESEISHGN